MTHAKPETHRLPCRKCDNETIHEVLQQIIDDKSFEGEGYIYYFEIVKCRGCEEISFRKKTISLDDCDYDPLTNTCEPTEYDELFPSRIAGHKELKDIHFLPPKILFLYRETHQALCCKLRILAGIGIRGLIEAICVDQGGKKGNLVQKIDGLVKLGLINDQDAEILHGTRLLGNDAAHEVKPLSEEELDVAMDVAEHLLKGVFILPKKAENFSKRYNALQLPTTSGEH